MAQESLPGYLLGIDLGTTATVVLFLASSAADFITGEAINVNGGSWMD